jgi:hypothetical protein
LLGHEYVRCYRYADDGPPASARTSTDARGGRIAPGWIDVGPLRQGVRPVTIASEDTVIHAGVAGNATDIAGEDEASGAYPSSTSTAEAAARTADAVAIQAACEAEADIFVTGRDYLHKVIIGCDNDDVSDQTLPHVTLAGDRVGSDWLRRTPRSTSGVRPTTVDS